MASFHVNTITHTLNWCWLEVRQEKEPIFLNQEGLSKLLKDRVGFL
jgi:hypothetical protein